MYNKELYKTEMCKGWSEKGKCHYGKMCNYAHGKEELVVTKKPEKYKSKLCIWYHKNGICNYGNRCSFVHREIKRLSVFEKIRPLN